MPMPPLVHAFPPAGSEQDGDLALSSTELASLFETAPSMPPGWDRLADTTVTNEKGYVTLQGFLSQWRCGARDRALPSAGSRPACVCVDDVSRVVSRGAGAFAPTQHDDLAGLPRDAGVLGVPDVV